MSANHKAIGTMVRIRFFSVSLLLAVLASHALAGTIDLARMARDYAPRVVQHPKEQYALSNVGYFFKRFRLVLKTPFEKYRYDVTPTNIHRLSKRGWTRNYTTTNPRWKNHWWFESRDGCEWKTRSATCDAVYLRADDPIATYQQRVVPEVYWRAVNRRAGGKLYTVIQYFFLIMLNDAQNKHDGEWESSAVVVDRDAYAAAGGDYRKLRRALRQILMAGHYRHDPFGQDVLRKHEASIFVPNSAHYQHVMSLGGHGGYLLVPESGRHEASMRCFESVGRSGKHYDVWAAPVRLVRVGTETPWIKYVGRWGRRYGLLAKLPMKFRFSFKPVGNCEGRFGLGWLKSRFQVIISAPFGPMFIHQTVWKWANFPNKPPNTPKAWR